MRPRLTSPALAVLAFAILAGLPACRVVDRMSVAMDPTTIKNPDVDEIDELEAREQGYFPEEGIPVELTAAEDTAAGMAIPGYNGAPIPGYTPSQPDKPVWPKPISSTQIPGYTPSSDTPNMQAPGAPIPPAPSSGIPSYDPSLIRELQQ